MVLDKDNFGQLLPIVAWRHDAPPVSAGRRFVGFDVVQQTAGDISLLAKQGQASGPIARRIVQPDIGGGQRLAAIRYELCQVVNHLLSCNRRFHATFSESGRLRASWPRTIVMPAAAKGESHRSWPNAAVAAKRRNSIAQGG